MFTLHNASATGGYTGRGGREGGREGGGGGSPGTICIPGAINQVIWVASTRGQEKQPTATVDLATLVHNLRFI